MASIINNVSLSRNVYSLRDIAKYEKISVDRINELMNDTLSMCIQCSPKKTASGICEWFNTVGCKDNNINRFLNHSKLVPFAKAIRLNSERCIRGKGVADFMMFSVEKKVYTDWKHKNIRYDPDVANVGKISDTGISYAKKADTRTVKLPNSRMLDRFFAVIKAAGFTFPEAILTAIQEYMTTHADAFGTAWKTGAEEISEAEVEGNKTSLVMAHIDPELNNRVYKTISRYNRINYPNIRFSDFLQAALDEKLDRLPLQYTDPELYKQMMEVAKQEEEIKKEVTGIE